MLYYNELPFGIIYFCSYLNIEIMNIISLDTEMEQITRKTWLSKKPFLIKA